LPECPLTLAEQLPQHGHNRRNGEHSGCIPALPPLAGHPWRGKTSPRTAPVTLTLKPRNTGAPDYIPKPGSCWWQAAVRSRAPQARERTAACPAKPGSGPPHASI